MVLSLDQGVAIVRFARQVIESHFRGERPEPPEVLAEVFAEDRGVFTTLKTYPEDRLRGCIGFPEPVMALGKAVVESAISAATGDPRFPAVQAGELSTLTVEVSVLTAPELIQVDDPREYPDKIEIGRDGLIVGKGYSKGLLLPQVPVEWKWDRQEFLGHTCMKAGLTPDCWLDPATRIWSFMAQVFSEKAPGGQIEEEKLTG